MLTADELAQVAAQLAARVREDDPQANARWLTATCPQPDDQWRLLFVLAAAVPVERTFSDLTAWTRAEDRTEGPLLGVVGDLLAERYRPAPIRPVKPRRAA